MSSQTLTRATLEDLMRVDGKAELIAGRIVHFMATGFRHNRISRRIANVIEEFVVRCGQGGALTDNAAFAVPELASGRESFSPDAAYFAGAIVDEEGVLPGPPAFAVEIRSPSDRGPAALREMAANRDDYYEAGTQVVWDVDPDTKLVHVYRPDQPDHPVTFGLGQLADAEPAMPGWKMKVDDIFA